MTATDLKPGVYESVPRAEYEAWPCANYSTLKLLVDPPAKARHKMLHPPEPTKELNHGDAFHAATLEPARFASDYVAAPSVDRRTTAGKTAWKIFEEANRGKAILPADDFEACLAMRASAWEEDSEAKAILAAPGKNELSIIWRDGEFQMLCKARIDRLCKWNGWSIVADAKSARSAAKEEFSRDIARYFYHAQAAFYLDGLTALAAVPRRWLWLVFEKEAPYLKAIYEPTERLLAQGRQTYRAWLRTFKECTETNNWPGYQYGVQEIDVPRWAQEETGSFAEGDAA